MVNTTPSNPEENVGNHNPKGAKNALEEVANKLTADKIGKYMKSLKI